VTEPLHLRYQHPIALDRFQLVTPDGRPPRLARASSNTLTPPSTAFDANVERRP